MPNSTAVIVIYSTPRLLGSVVTDAKGDFSKPVTVPTDLEDGVHHLVASGFAPDGTDRFLRMDVTVSSGSGGGDDGSALAFTGADVAVPVGIGLAALVGGAFTLLAARRRRPAGTIGTD